jgi:exoribonuclease II
MEDHVRVIDELSKLCLNTIKEQNVENIRLQAHLWQAIEAAGGRVELFDRHVAAFRPGAKVHSWRDPVDKKWVLSTKPIIIISSRE